MSWNKGPVGLPKIHEAEQLVRGRHYFVVSDSLFRSHPELEGFHFVADEPARSRIQQPSTYLALQIERA
jgi:hypothetical protein